VSARDVVIDVFLILGTALVLVSCLGVLAFRGAHDRLHFTAPATLGALSIAIAVLTKESFSLVGDKAILIAVFLVAAAPMVTHAIGRAARTAEHGDWTIQPGEAIEIEDDRG